MALGGSGPGFQKRMADSVARAAEIRGRARRNTRGSEIGSNGRRVVAWFAAIIALGLMLYAVSGYGTVSVIFAVALIAGAVGAWRLVR